MDVSRKFRGSSAFLRSANNTPYQSSFSGEEAAQFGDSDLLEVLARMRGANMQVLSKELSVDPAEIVQSVNRLVGKGLLEPVEREDQPVCLSETGERALRYTKMAKF